MGTIDAFQRLVWSPQFKQNCFPHRSKMGVLKSFPKAYARIDLMNHGYNAIIDACTWTQSINRFIYHTVRGRPALIVSKSYTGNIDLLEEHCNDDFTDMIYGKAIHHEDP